MAMVKELQYDITHLSLKDYVTMENDAKSWYDRVVPSLIFLISRSFGVRRSICCSVGSTFERTRHHVATKIGISKHTFGHTKEEPIYGSWQGATTLVVSWVLNISVIQEIHCEEVPGASFEMTYGKTKVIQFTIGFMDDNNNYVTREDNTSELEELLQTRAQTWEKLLYSTGGTLELSKCFTYSVKWKHNKTERHRMSEDQANINIMESILNSTVKVKSKPTNKSHKTLGCYKNPAMLTRDQTIELREKSIRSPNSPACKGCQEKQRGSLTTMYTCQQCSTHWHPQTSQGRLWMPYRPKPPEDS